MKYWIWIIFDLLYLIGSYLFILFVKPSSSTIVSFAKLTAWFSFILFMFNASMYLIFSIIKKSSNRHIKIKFAKISRIIFKPHIQFGIIGTGFIVLHAIIMTVKGGSYFGYFHPTLVTGYVAILLLAINLYAGYLRHLKASKKRRLFHLRMALIFTGSFLIHILF